MELLAVAKHFYTEFVPQREGLIPKALWSEDATMKEAANTLQATLDEVLNSDTHKWYLNKPDPEEVKASVSFNRLFPGRPYIAVLEIGQDMSSFWQVRCSVTAHPTEAITTGLHVNNSLQPFAG